MDVFEKVQQTKPEIEDEDLVVDTARTRLMREIEGEGRPARAGVARRPWIVAGGLVGAAAAVAVAVLVMNGLASPAPTVHAEPTREPGRTFSPEPSPEPTVAPITPTSVLTGAASVVGTHPAPVAAPGQYLKVEHHNRQLVLHSPEEPLNATRAQATSGWVATNSYTSYIPGDPLGEWVDVFDPELEIVDLYGVDAPALSLEWLAVFSWRTDPIVMRYQADGDGESGDAIPNQTFRHYADMPRDPAGLLAWVRAYLTGLEPGTEDMGVATFLMQEMQLGLAPVDLRAAMYRALALIPNGVVSGTDGDIVTLSFLTYPPHERWDTISIDTRTALVTQVSTTLGSGGTVVPDSIPNSTSTLTISVVDAAP